MKLCIFNFGKYMSRKKARNRLSKAFGIVKDGRGIDNVNLPGLVSIEKGYKSPELFLEFDCKESAERAMSIVQGHNDDWHVSVVQSSRKRTASSRGGGGDGDGGSGGRATKIPKWRPITEVVTPLAHLSYPQQLEQKENELLKLMHDLFVRKLYSSWKEDGDMPQYLRGYRKRASERENDDDDDSSGAAETKEVGDNEEKSELQRQTDELISRLPFEWCGIIGSPVINGYRNNCEFTCGYSVDGKTSVGFLQGSFQDGYLAITHPQDCLNISDHGKRICTLMQAFIDTNCFADTLKCYSKTDHTGFWRLVKLRENLEGHLMLMFQINPTGVDQATIDRVKQDLIEYFMKHKDAEGETKLDIKSMFLQSFDGVSNAAPSDTPMEKIFGEDHIYETVSGIKFQVSPLSFFQVNTLGAEKLYQLAREWCAASPNETLLDVCCGTGTIGLTMASSVKRVVGIEMVESAVEDARRNAQLNGIENAEFICGKAEDTIRDVIIAEKARGNSLTAIVDPPRGGLHPSVLRTLSRTKEIDRLVYVSCNPKTLVQNAEMICSPPNKRMGHYVVPFRPVKAIGCDMFPHTSHCEMVVLFERIPPSEQQTKTE